jgi:hypothetical protein
MVPRLIVGNPVSWFWCRAADARLNLVHKAASGVYLADFLRVLWDNTMAHGMIDVHAQSYNLVRMGISQRARTVILSETSDWR